MAVAPREQRALLRMERSLAKDLGVRAALSAHQRGCARRPRATPECTSSWHPVLWRAAGVAMTGLLIAFVVTIIVLLLRR